MKVDRPGFGIKPGDVLILGYRRSRIWIVGSIINWWRERKAKKGAMTVTHVSSTTLTISPDDEARA